MKLTHDKSYEKYHDRISVLDNGVTVATRTLEPRHYSSSRSHFAVTVLAGAVDEKSGPRGIAHFVEHTLFGEITQARWREFLSAHDYAGMTPSAMTWPEKMIFAFDGINGTVTAKSDLLDMLALQMENVLNPDLSVENIENERKRILLELSGQSTADYEHHKEFTANMFPDMPADMVISSWANIEAISRHDLQSFYTENYVGKKILVTVVYPAAADPALETVTHDLLVDRIKDYFSHLPTGAERKPRLRYALQSGETRLSLLNKPGSSDVEIYIAYPGPFPKASPREIFVESLMKEILRKALEKDIYAQGLSYYWKSKFNWGGADYTYFHFVVDRVNAAAISNLFVSHLRKLALEDDGTLAKALDEIKRSSLKEDEIYPIKSDSAHGELLMGLIYNKQPAHPEIFAKAIQNVTVEEIRDYARGIIHGPIAMRVDGDMDGKYAGPLPSFLKKLRDGIPKPDPNAFSGAPKIHRRRQPQQ